MKKQYFLFFMICFFSTQIFTDGLDDVKGIWSSIQGIWSDIIKKS